MASKYVVGDVQNGMMSIQCAICFPDVIGHADMQKCFVPDTIVGAGFFYIQDGTAVAYGKSVGLKIDSRPELDSACINYTLGFGRNN